MSERRWAFIRRGSSKKKLREEEIRELKFSKGESSLEREDTCQAYPGNFDRRAIQEFAASVIEKLSLKHTNSDEEVLETRRLGKMRNRKFIPNKACALLFSRDPCLEIPGCRIRFLRFDGKDEGFGEKYNAVKDLWIEGNVPSLLRQIEEVIESQLREFSQLGKDGKFATSPEYPKPAWYNHVVPPGLQSALTRN